MSLFYCGRPALADLLYRGYKPFRLLIFDCTGEEGEEADPYPQDGERLKVLHEIENLFGVAISATLAVATKSFGPLVGEDGGWFIYVQAPTQIPHLDMGILYRQSGGYPGDPVFSHSSIWLFERSAVIAAVLKEAT